MKKLLLFLLFVITTSMSMRAETYADIDKIRYKLYSSDFHAEVIAKGEKPYYTDIIRIPSSVNYNGYKYTVTKIGDEAFRRRQVVTDISIPNTITEIGSKAFEGCSYNLRVYISDIAAWCGINFCDSLSNPLSCAHRLYLNNELVTDLVIPEGVTVISNWAFYNSYSYLTSVTIPNSVTSIGNGAFWNCTGLTSIDIPNSVTSLGESAFRHCSNLTSFTIPNGVTSIGSYVFQNCSNLTSITIPNSVTSIGSYVFQKCSNLTSITIPNSVTSIGNSVFQECI